MMIATEGFVIEQLESLCLNGTASSWMSLVEGDPGEWSSDALMELMHGHSRRSSHTVDSGRTCGLLLQCTQGGVGRYVRMIS